MNPFAHHGIKHLSASSLGLYRNEPSLWVLRYLYGMKGEGGPSAWRGTAVEKGVDKLLYENCSDDDAIDIAQISFEMNAQGEISEEIDKELAVIPDMVREASKLLRPLGMPTAHQYKVEYWLDGIEVPVIGFVDYLYPDFLIDLKTTSRMPSEPRLDHAAQVAVYGAATKRQAQLAYVTPKKGALYPVEQTDDAMWLVNKSAKAVRAMLARCETKEEAAELFVPDWSSFYWDDATKRAALETWGSRRISAKEEFSAAGEST